MGRVPGFHPGYPCSIPGQGTKVSLKPLLTAATPLGVEESKLPKWLHYRTQLLIQCNPYQITNGIIHRTRTKKISKFVWRHKRPWIAKEILREKNEAGGIMLQAFRVYYKGTITKTVWYWHKNRNIDQWNRIESPEISPCTYGQLSSDKEGKNILKRNGTLCKKWCWESSIATCKRMKLKYSLISHREMNSKWINDLNVTPDTIKVRGKHRQNTLWYKSQQYVFSFTA